MKQRKPKPKQLTAKRRQGNRPGQAGQGRPGQAGQGRPGFQQALKQFDKDGDGKLTGQERVAAQAHFAKMRGGQPSNKGAKNRIPEQVLKRFDKDGDGELNNEERAAAMKAREEYLKKNGNASDRRRNDQAMPNMKELMARFDKNGDGKLDDGERAEIAKLRQQRGGAGRPAAEAKEKPGRVDKKELLAKFDADWRRETQLRGESRRPGSVSEPR